MEIEIILYICLRSYQESAFIQQNLFQTSRNTQIPQVRLSMSRIWPQLQFATSIRVKENPDVEEIDSDDEELSNEEKLNRSRWLFAGGKDNRVSIWPLMSFDKQIS